ncbi:gliding motility-associated C-terminal domain-containing protein [Mucilaginibacter gynuensis]|uniref:gliding motility-associated C-terminal domain-containing protein n=1 Tax=Mucilaginibacter gynuensis TaxID=1302236 RepID=UPI0031EE0C35
MIIRLLLCVLFAICTGKVSAQVCTGNYGDPVIEETFGNGSSAPLSTQQTNYKYVVGRCPENGEYSIVKFNPGCHTESWHTVLQDHTTDRNGAHIPGGNMMLVNASEDKGLFFTQTAHNLCAGTTYKFSVFVLDLMRPNPARPDALHPTLRFKVKRANGEEITHTNKDPIPIGPTAGPQFQEIFTTFIVPGDANDVVVEIYNDGDGGYGNDLILDDITFRACGPDVLTGFDDAGTPMQKSICVGEASAYALKVSTTANFTERQWQRLEGETWVDIKGENRGENSDRYLTPDNLPAGMHQYRVAVAKTNNLDALQCRIYSDIITLNIKARPVVPPFNQQPVCEGSNVTLTASGGTQYKWSGPGITSPVFKADPNLTIPNITFAQGGTYSVQAITDGCPGDETTVEIDVKPKIIATITSDVEVCEGVPVALEATGGVNYKWTPSTGLSADNIPNPVAVLNETTPYTVTIDNGACTETRTVTIKIIKNAKAIVPGTIEMNEGQFITLNGGTAGDVNSFYWTPALYLDNPNSLTPIASPLTDTRYVLHVSGRCEPDTAGVFIKVYNKIKVPNSFSPNGDGINDYWNIPGLATYPNSVTTVYNRYGQEVFRSTGYARPWSGSYNGYQLPGGTYYYIIDPHSKSPRQTGWVLIVR